ncbi:MAG: hypothetical protein JNK78_16160 [Planctomycetes bacterium]|nr:hypothetical protein [Planctomycetota bacterium]
MSERPLPRSLPLLAACFFLMAAASTARADELRLDDGRVLVGKVVERGDTLEVTTIDGVVAVPKAKVTRRRTDDELRTDLAKRAREQGDTPYDLLQLAQVARDFGLDAEMWRYADQVVKALGNRTSDDSSRATRRRLEEFLGQLEPQLLPRRFRSAATALRVHELLDRLRADTSPGRAAAIETLLVREPNADQDLRTEARRSSAERRRIGALSALERRELAGNDRFVLRTAILDGSAEVRRTAIDIARGRADADAVAYLAPGLTHPNGKVRIRTAEAFANLGHSDAVKMIVMAGPSAGAGLAGGGNGVRAHVAFLQQQAYIRDYDVEVAQAAFVADPKVDALTSGTVLDVTVAGVYEETVIVRAWQRALKDLTKSDPGADPRTWASWLANLQPAPTAPLTAPR